MLSVDLRKLYRKSYKSVPVYAISRFAHSVYLLSSFHTYTGLQINISVIGTPRKEMWPRESSISADQFGIHKPIAWTELIVGADYQAIDLISVRKLLHTLKIHKKLYQRSGLIANCEFDTTSQLLDSQ